MAEVIIKAHTRRGKGGKTVQVRGYTRRVGRKGVHSPKLQKEKPGEELLQKKETIRPVLSKEELAERKKVLEGFDKAEKERKMLGMTREQYSRMLRKSKSKKEQSEVITPRKSLKSLEKLEDKVAKFVKKYSNKTYKKQL